MGKKSRKKNKNGKTAVPSIASSARGGGYNADTILPYHGATALALPSSCFHGSNLADFKNLEYIGAIQAYFLMKSDLSKIGTDNPLCYQIVSQRVQKFYDDYKHLITLDADFCRFIFAYCTHLYQKSHHSLRVDSDQKDVSDLLSLGIKMRYTDQVETGVNIGPGSENREKWHKYQRDIHSERGVIKCLDRETPCNCMDAKMAEAKGMDKTNMCNGCKNYVPKTSLSNCSGCDFARYCSKACQVNDWPIHRDWCKTTRKRQK